MSFSRKNYYGMEHMPRSARVSFSRTQTTDPEIRRVLATAAKVFNPLLGLHRDLQRFKT